MLHATKLSSRDVIRVFLYPIDNYRNYNIAAAFYEKQDSNALRRESTSRAKVRR